MSIKWSKFKEVLEAQGVEVSETASPGRRHGRRDVRYGLKNGPREAYLWVDEKDTQVDEPRARRVCSALGVDYAPRVNKLRARALVRTPATALKFSGICRG